jgi:hypothetical protein
MVTLQEARKIIEAAEKRAKKVGQPRWRSPDRTSTAYTPRTAGA